MLAVLHGKASKNEEIKLSNALIRATILLHVKEYQKGKSVMEAHESGLNPSVFNPF